MEASRKWEDEDDEPAHGPKDEGGTELQDLSHEDLVKLASDLLSSRARTQIGLAIAGAALQERITMLLSFTNVDGSRHDAVDAYLRGMLDILGSLLEGEKIVPRPVFDAGVELGLKVHRGEIDTKEASRRLLDVSRPFGGSEEGIAAVNDLIEALNDDEREPEDEGGSSTRSLFI
jgi:hypothetical protein